MRFLLRTLIGAMLVLALCGVVLSFGMSKYRGAQEEAAKEPPKRSAPERSFTVRDQLLVPATVSPVMVAYGTIEAGRTLELRAAQPGRVVDITSDFKDGAQVTAGTRLIRIDPSLTRSREADAMSTLADARSREDQAVQAVQLAEADLETAQRQLDLRRNALKRRVDLAQRGLVARTAVEEDQLALAAADQVMITRRQALANARKQVEQARLTIDRADITVSDARRDIADTEITAPFDGVLNETSVALGRLVSANETLGSLIDLTSLEVAFRVSDVQFSRILDENGDLLPLRARVSLKLGERSIDADAVLVRTAATTATEGGRIVYASIAAPRNSPFRPGDFVSVRVTESPLANVAEIPARAATENGTVYVIGEDSRLERATVTILRRMSDTIVVGDAPFGKRIVAELRPQLGPGIKVQTQAEALAAQEEARKKAAQRGTAGGKPGGEKTGEQPDGKGPSGERDDEKPANRPSKPETTG